MSQPFVGEVKLFGFSFAPRNYALCNGQTLPIAQNQALFSLLGTLYGGNGQTTFGLPNVQGRTPVHFAAQLPQASQFGAEAVTLTTPTIPAHTHALNGTGSTANRRVPGGNVFANDTSTSADFFAPTGNLVAINPASTAQTGGGQPHPNMQPYLVMNYCIALSGIFPSRN